MSIEHDTDFSKASFKDFEAISNLNAFERAGVFRNFTYYMEEHGQMNYRFVTTGGCGPEIWVQSPFNEKPLRCVSQVINYYLNFTKHPKVKAAAIAGIEKYGTGAGESPLIGRAPRVSCHAVRETIEFFTARQVHLPFTPPVIFQTALHCWRYSNRKIVR
ncbi:hypothetical protein [Pedobacter cryoconitis]|uniref:Glycine C-acetyltransferase n=1 Tax=Pedobacter cryoconitis TaxID=188932 RepID=A0A327S0Y3_9SPHI|nr:hypothetical protein [Pedobacter cryoconitis]RAJ22375.1 glycine C-acetyltransferase [Pedobacter cryoconitis]